MDERDTGGGEAALRGPNSERQDAGVGRGLCLGGTCLGLCQSWPFPSERQELPVRSQQGVCGRGRRGGGQGRLDKPAHTRQMFAQEDTGVVMQI